MTLTFFQITEARLKWSWHFQQWDVSSYFVLMGTIRDNSTCQINEQESPLKHQFCVWID